MIKGDMSVIKSNMATIAVYYTKSGCMVTPKFYDCNPCVHVRNAYNDIFKKVQKLNHRYIFKFKAI